MSRIMCGVTFLILSASASGGLFPVVSVEPKLLPIEGGYYSPLIRGHIIEVGAASDAAVRANVEVIGLARCWDNGGGVRQCLFESGKTIAVDRNLTFGENALSLYPTGWSAVYNHIPGWNLLYCWGVMGMPAGRSPTGNAWSGAFVQMVPGGCVMGPPSSEWCKVDTPSVVFDHGVVDRSGMEDHESSDTLQVTCTARSYGRFRLLEGEEGVRLGGGMAYLNIGGYPVGSKLTLAKGTSELRVVSRLRGVKEGEWAGSGVLVLELE